MLNSVGSNSQTKLINPLGSHETSKLKKDDRNLDAADKKKNLSTELKIGLGIGLLATIAIAGIAINKSRTKKIASEIEKEIRNYSDKIKNACEFPATYLYDSKITKKYLDDAMRLPQKERLERLKELDESSKISSFIRNDALYGYDKEYTAQLKDAIKSKDPLKVRTAYIEYVNSFDNVFLTVPTAGKTVEESIKNTFKGVSKHNIKPYTYNLSEEADRIFIAANNDFIGFHNKVILSGNRVPHRLNSSIDWDKAFTYSGQKIPEKESLHRISQGIRKDGTPFVQLSYWGKVNTLGMNDAPCSITLISPNKSLTPAQKDLLKLKDMKDFPIDDFRVAGGSADNFDAMLSLIQTTASKVK